MTSLIYNGPPKIPYAKQWARLTGVPEGTLRGNIIHLLEMMGYQL